MLVLVSIQSLISALVFLFFKPKHIANRLLATWFLMAALNFVGFMVPGGLKAWIGIGYLPFLLLNGPLFYFYVRSIVQRDFRFTALDTLHLLPFVLLAAGRLFWLQTSLDPAFYYKGSMAPDLLLLYGSISVSILAYLLAIYLLLLRHQRNIREYFSNASQKITLSWVFFMVLTFSLSYLIFLFVPLLPLDNFSADQVVFWYNQFNMALLGFLLLIFGLLQPLIYTNAPVSSRERQNLEEAKYGKGRLEVPAMQLLAVDIRKYLDERKPWLDPDYNLEQMARDLNQTRHHLSQTINEQMGKNFFQLVNQYRVAEFKRLVLDPHLSHLTFLGLAFDAGFNSKSSFNRIFKEETGVTPSEYKQQVLQ